MTDQNKQFDPGGKQSKLFISATWLSMLYTVCSVVRVFLLCLPCNFPCYHTRYFRQQELSAEDESDRETQTRGAAFELAMGLSRFSTQKGYTVVRFVVAGTMVEVVGTVGFC